MKIRSLVSSLRKWVSDPPMQDPVDRQMAALIQVILLGFIAMILIAGILNLAIPPALPWSEVLLQSFVSTLIISIPLALLRRGHFHTSVSVVIALFFTFETYAVITIGLLGTVGTLLFFTLTLILAALMLGRRALLLTFTLIAGLVLLGAFREPSAERRADGLVVAINIILLNGLISLFLDQFGLAFRNALRSSLEREEALQNEIDVRMQAEGTLRQREWEFESLANNIPDIVARFDQQLRHVYINDVIETITGIPAQAFIGKTNRDLSMPEEQVILWDDKLRHIFNTGQAGRLEFDFPSRAGIRHFESWLVPEFGPREKVENVLSIVRDVTERKQTEESLRASEERFRVTLRDLPIIIFNQDRELRYTWIVNPHPGFSNELSLGKTDAELLPPEEARHLNEVKQQVLFTGVGARSEVKTTIAGVTYFYDLIVEPMRDSNGNIVGITCASLDITERKTAEARLQASEARYRLATRATKDVIWEWNAQTNQLLWTENAQYVFGYLPEEVGPEEKWWDEHIHPDDRERVVSKLNALTAGNESIWQEDYRFLLKDGSYAYISDHGYIERDADGQPLRMIGAMSNITERKQAEEALRESEAKIQNIIRHSTSMFYAHTPDHVLTYVSPQSREILGCEPEEAMVRWQEFLSDHPSNQKGIEATERAIETGERQPPYELELMTRTGRRIWVQVDESPVVKDGQTTAMVGSVTDITERKQAEEELRKSREQFATIIESAGIGTWQWNVQTGETIFNERWAEIVGYTLEELAPVSIKTWEALTHPDDLQRSAELLQKHFAGSSDYYDCECRMKHKDGHWVWIHDRGKVVSRTSDSQPIWMYGTHAAITERKQAELQIQHLSRLYATLSGMNHAIMRVKNREELFDAICRVIVEYGKFGLAWIGLFDREAGEVIPVAMQSTTQGGFPFQSINIHQAPFKSGLIGTALDQGRIVYSQDIQTDPTMQHWRNTPIGDGLHAAAAIPFQLDGEISGLLNLYVTDIDFFAGAEQFNLLEEIGDDISYALNTLQLERRRKSAEENLRRNEEVLRLFVEHSPAAIAMLDRDMKYITASRRYLIDYDLGIQDITGLSHYEVFPEIPERWKQIHQRCLAGAIEKADEDPFPRQSGRLDWVRWEIRPWHESNGSVGGIIIFSEVITERKRAAEALRQSEKNYRAIVENTIVGVYRTTLSGNILYVNEALAQMLEFATPDEMMAQEVIARYADPKDREITLNMLREEGHISAMDLKILTRTGKVRDILLSASLEGEILTGIILDVTERKQAQEALGKTSRFLESIISAAPLAIITYDANGFVQSWNAAATRIFGWSEQEALGKLPPSSHEAFSAYLALQKESVEGKSLASLQVAAPKKDGSLITVNAYTAPLYDHRGQISGFMAIIEDITDRKRAEEALQEKERLLSESQRIGHVGSWSYDIAADSLQFSDEMYRLLDISPAEFQHNWEAFLRLIYSLDRPMVAKWMEDIRTGRQAQELEFRIFRKNGELSYLRCKGADVSDVTGGPLRFIGTVQDVTERKLAEIQIRQQIERLTALREIDQAISSSFHLSVTLHILLSHVVAKLQVDAAGVLLLEPDGRRLTYAAGQGFHSNAIETASLRLSDSQALRERRAIHIENLENKPDPRLLTTQGHAEGFVSYVGIPLIVKGNIIGVLEIFHRAPLHPYEEWLDFLNTLAGQAAIAIENKILFENLERSNRELSQAYDATIEGWSRALDLRDRETEGHTQRVTEITLELARAFGLPEEELLYVRWGALLHDIGKMGVPDHILLKPGGLTEEEWVQMRNHPQYAYDLLKPITFLAPALDIPYSHHEKWDGTGYPRRLKGEEIPLVARLFAVVDVWDALRSDRPYRPAWTKEEAIGYIESRAGTHFDPRVVERFAAILSR